jgi:hypothetical protein
MVLLLNALPLLIVALTILLIVVFVKRNKQKYAVYSTVAMLVLMMLYMKVQPSYLPKGTVERSEIPAFEEKEGLVRDSLRKPVSTEERDVKRMEEIKKGLPFLPEK